MEIRENPFIEIHQCIFGYNNGHRLLASSLNLPPEIESELLIYSDLNPGTYLMKGNGYWTGIPLHLLKQYALMRTWAAPEMSRPGCVWTHVLLIAFADIARFEDLGVLKQFFQRPNNNLGFEKYYEVMKIKEEDLSAMDKNLHGLKQDRLLETIRVVYDRSSKFSLFGKINDFENEIFRIWSQQWPALRRDFSFRNAGGSNDLLNSEIKFDIQIFNEENKVADVYGSYNPTQVETVIISDLIGRNPTAFRRFIWRYGSDSQIGKDVFYRLAEVYLFTINYENIKAEKLLQKIAEYFRNPNECLILKNDLISVKNNPYSLVPSVDPFESIRFLIEKPELNVGFQDIQLTTLIQWLWIERREKLMTLANYYEEPKSRIRNLIVSEIVGLIDPNEVFPLTGDYLELRKKIIICNPEFLDNEYLIEIGEDEVLMYFDLIHLDSNLNTRVITKLLQKDSEFLANALFTKYPNEVTEIAFSYLNQQQLNWTACRTWLSVITSDVSWIISNGFIDGLTSKTAIALVAQCLGLENGKVFKIGPKPWLDILKKTKDEAIGALRDYLNLFLIILSLRNPQRGVEYFFEYAFESLYSRILDNALSYEEWNILSRNLPLPHWWQLLDLSYRLRVGLVDAYVWNDLDRGSFLKVVNDKLLMMNLVEIALDSKKGKKYLKKED
ncbi:hypothetical protein LEP1GSC104_2110 [Leptospira interrogans str. UI 12621]|uniref:Uncharacterized protein n=1 Tax=Leptospira interrogans str. UI 12621 TaxID=1049937 RepID=A0A0F6H6I7_LEPIR|nr:hypothetical protein LEP1GSC104_2110 [Leptospira interrogans str. UI 12621]